jgi:hypothetical protein
VTTVENAALVQYFVRRGEMRLPERVLPMVTKYLRAKNPAKPVRLPKAGPKPTSWKWIGQVCGITPSAACQAWCGYRKFSTHMANIKAVINKFGRPPTDCRSEQDTFKKVLTLGMSGMKCSQIAAVTGWSYQRVYYHVARQPGMPKAASSTSRHSTQ